MRTKLKEMYLDYVNNWLTTQAFADHHNIDISTMQTLLEIAKRLHEDDVITYKELQEILKNK